MRPFLRRVIGYGSALPIAAVLAYYGFMHVVDPGADHAVLQAEIKLRYAALMPKARADRTPVAERAAMIDDALGFLDQAERLAPPTQTTVEYRAYAAYLQGDARAAAATYDRATGLATDPGSRAELALSAARMLVLAGDDAAALPRLEAVIGTGVPAAAAAAGLERARLLLRQGRTDAAMTAARVLATDASAPAEVSVGAGEVLESGGDDATAASAYERVAPTYPLANYFVARLKARAGDVDNAVQMLERALSGSGNTVRLLVQRDAADWGPCRNDGRFQGLFPGLEAARPGR